MQGVSDLDINLSEEDIRYIVNAVNGIYTAKDPLAMYNLVNLFETITAGLEKVVEDGHFEWEELKQFEGLLSVLGIFIRDLPKMGGEFKLRNWRDIIVTGVRLAKISGRLAAAVKKMKNHAPCQKCGHVTE